MVNKILVYLLFICFLFLPTHVFAYNADWAKIIDKNITIKEVDVVQCDGIDLGYGWDGCNNTDTKEIFIKKSLDDKRKDDVFYEELGHQLFNKDPLAPYIFDRNFLSDKEYYHDWWENASLYTSYFFTGRIEPNLQFFYVMYKITVSLGNYLMN